MKKPLLALLIILLTSAGLNAQLFSSDLEKGLKALEKSEFEKAIELFNSILKEDSAGVGAHYGLASVYFTKSYSGFNADKAYDHIVVAQRNFPLASKKQVATLAKSNITKTTIDDLRKKIDDELFSEAAAQFSTTALTAFIDKYPNNSNIADAKMLLQQLTLFNVTSSNSEEALDEYIRKNQGSKEIDKAIKVRNKLAFQKAKAANTITALQEFIDTHPDAEEVEEAKIALASLEFLEAKQLNTMAAFDTFMVRYPEAIEYREAMMLRNQLAYIQLLEEQSQTKSAEITQKNAELVETGNQLNWVIGGLGIVLILAGILFWSYSQKKKSNREITLQKEIIEQKNTEIVDSINYAKRIQDSMLPSLQEIRSHLPETFVFYRPRNIVSGDFYWFAESGSKIFIAAADCTGHGVPGSLVSMIGFNFLNQLVNESELSDPGEILDMLHLKISSTLNKDANSAQSATSDGMDIALMSIDKKTSEIRFSGAVRPLVYFDSTGVNIIRSGMYSIGGIKSLADDPFETHTIKPNGKATFYLFSDGFADQFGGPQGKKFKMKKLRELLEKMSTLPFHEQEKHIDREFNSWKGEHEQVDDICVIGIRY